MAATGDLELDDWGRHLRADYRHDTLESRNNLLNIPYNRGRRDAVHPDTGNEFDEDGFMEYAMNRPYIAGNAEFKARIAGRVEFKLPMKNAVFDGTAPQVFDGGNIVVGLVMDAGKYLTDYLGSQNAISFGMCIDPAKSSIGPKDRPVFFEPTNKKVYIQLAQFGFDPAVIQGIWIVNVMGGSLVQSVWMMGPDHGNQRIDPVKRRKLNPIPPGVPPHEEAALGGIDTAQLGLKRINFETPETAGYYTSINNASDAGGVGADFYKMGKTLGDTMIVASAMPKYKLYLPGGVVEKDNPYYGINQPTGIGMETGVWKNHFNTNNPYPYTTGPTPNPPKTLLVKTGDQLNAIRAIFKGVPVILERQAKGTRPKFFEFYPGVPAPAQIIKAIDAGYDRLVKECEQRYDALINNLKAARLADDSINYEYTKFVVDGTRLRFPSDRRNPDDLAKLRAAWAFLNETVAELEKLKTICAGYLTGVKTAFTTVLETLRQGATARGATLEDSVTMSDLKDIKEVYSTHMRHMLQISPQSTVVIEDRVVKPVIVVSRVGPAGLDIGGGAMIQDTEIHFLAALSAIAEGSPAKQGVVLERLFNRIPAAAVVPVTPEESATSVAYLARKLLDWIKDVIGFFPAIVGGARPKGIVEMEESAPPTVTPGPLYENPGIPQYDFPTTFAFLEYLAEHGVGDNQLTRLTMIRNLLRMKDSPRIIDQVVLRAIDREFINLHDGGYLVFPTQPIPGAQLNNLGLSLRNDIMIPNDLARSPSYSTVESLAFNAFAMHINAMNSTMTAGPEEGPPDRLFVEMENEFLKALETLRPLAFGVPGTPETLTGALSPTASLAPASTPARKAAEVARERVGPRQAATATYKRSLRGGRLRTFRQKRAKKNKDAGNRA